MPRLNQIIALEKRAKTHFNETITSAHHKLQRDTLLTGISRTYTPVDIEGEKYPDEVQVVQVKADDMIDVVTESLGRMLDISATNYLGNCQAYANVEVGGELILERVPVTFLLNLEKKLTDIHTFIKKLPVLDPSERWQPDKDTATHCYVTLPTERAKTKKVPRALVKAPATKEHPAQVDTYYEDVVEGHWAVVKFSGALPPGQVQDYLDRVEELQDAVKVAREEANSTMVENVKIAHKILDFLFPVDGTATRP